jgi:hypothetical protein
MSLQTIEYRGWKDCLLLDNGDIELVVSVGLGPRVLSFKRKGGANFFKNFDDQMANISQDTWQSYGGHRLWHAPEVWTRTYYPDVQPVKYEMNGSRLTLTCETETTSRLQKEIIIDFPDSGTLVKVTHRIYNRGPWAAKFAPWALSVMAPGGTVIVPQEPFVPHGPGEGQSFAAGRAIVLWQFTNMADPRFVWGKRFIRMSQDDAYPTKQKFGGMIKPGWAAYDFGSELFIKRFAFFPGANYPDYGCNAEFYTEPGMLEIESLGPEVPVEPGDYAEHIETWQIEQVAASKDDDTLTEQLKPFGL